MLSLYEIEMKDSQSVNFIECDRNFILYVKNNAKV